ncbi:MAG TPA: YbaN family protein [Burkholderiales bacterium]
MRLERHPRNDYGHEVRAHASPLVRGAFLALGTLCVVVAVIGVVVPVLPTTPFLLLAAACYVRASARFYNWLLNSPAFGPLVLEWRRHRSIPWRTKITAIVLMSTTLAASIVFYVDNGYARAGLALLGVGLAVWLYRIPSRDRPRPSGAAPER